MNTNFTKQPQDFKWRLVLKHVIFMPRMFFKKITKKLTANKDEQMKSLQNDILEGFLYSLKKRDIHQKEAFLLSGFSDDIKRLSIKNGLEDALITKYLYVKKENCSRISWRADGNAWQRSTSWYIQCNLLFGQGLFEIESLWLYWNFAFRFWN